MRLGWGLLLSLEGYFVSHNGHGLPNPRPVGSGSPLSSEVRGGNGSCAEEGVLMGSPPGRRLSSGPVAAQGRAGTLTL